VVGVCSIKTKQRYKRSDLGGNDGKKNDKKSIHGYFVFSLYKNKHRKLENSTGILMEIS